MVSASTRCTACCWATLHLARYPSHYITLWSSRVVRLPPFASYGYNILLKAPLAPLPSAQQMSAAVSEVLQAHLGVPVVRTHMQVGRAAGGEQPRDQGGGPVWRAWGTGAGHSMGATAKYLAAMQCKGSGPPWKVGTCLMRCTGIVAAIDLKQGGRGLASPMTCPCGDQQSLGSMLIALLHTWRQPSPGHTHKQLLLVACLPGCTHCHKHPCL